jgi:ribonuclease P protein component
LAISKKTVKSAVSRNRIKRIIKESFRLSEIVINGYDLVVMAQKKLESTNGKLMRKSLELHWRKIQTCEKP